MDSQKLKLKTEGNEAFANKNFHVAVLRYSEALKLDPNDIDILSNRALVYNHMGRFNLALSDTETALKIDPLHAKCNFRKVKSLWGLKRYEDALDFLKTAVPKEILETPAFIHLMPTTRKFIRQSKGEYDMVEMMKLPLDKCHEVAEFTGPVKIAPVSGKGRGLLATTDINPGQLIICSKAIAFVAETPKGSSSECARDMIPPVLAAVHKKFNLDPSFRKAYCSLYAGPNSTKKQGWLYKKCSDVSDDIVILDDKPELEVEVDNRAIFNTIGPINMQESDKLFYGLWLIPSYLNHSCLDSNANYKMYGDILMIRAVRKIKSGEEITISYCRPTDKSSRESLMVKHKFQCDCQLCRLELTEDPKITKAIEKTVKLIEDNLIHTDSDNLAKQYARVKKLGELRSGNPRANLAYCEQPVVNFKVQLVHLKEWKMAAELYEDAWKVLRNTTLVDNVVTLSEIIMNCYLELGDMFEADKWKHMMEMDRITAYGVNARDGQRNRE